MSVVSGCVTLYNSLAMSVTKPPLYFDGIPQTTSSGAKQDLPWVNLVDEGLSTDQSGQEGFDFEYNPVELSTVRFEVFGLTLAQVDGVMNGIKYGTGTATGRAGFDFGAVVVTGQTVMECRRVSEHRFRSDKLQEGGLYVYQGDIRYSIQAKVN